MTDADLVSLKLARIEGLVADLETLAKPDLIRTDILQQRFVEHTLQLAIQCALDVASHIVADDALGVPGTNKELFAILARHGWLSSSLGESLVRMVGFRNVLVHGYDDVDLGIVEDTVRNRLGDLLAFAAAVRARVPE